MLKALLLHLIFSIPATSLLIVFLKYSQELRDFCYAYKFGIITNGLGIVKDIRFYNKDFLMSHPEIIIEKKSDSRKHPLKRPVSRWKTSWEWKGVIILSMTRAFPVVRMIPLFQWSVKEADFICVVDFPLWNSSVRKWNGNGTILLRNPNVYAIVITHAQLLPAEEWFTSTLKEIFVLTQDVFVVRKKQYTNQSFYKSMETSNHTYDIKKTLLEYSITRYRCKIL